MEKELYTLPNLKNQRAYTLLTKDLIDRNFDTDLDHVEGGEDLCQVKGLTISKRGEVTADQLTRDDIEVFVEIRIGTALKNKDYTATLSRIGSLVSKIKPTRYILVYYEDKDIPQIKSLTEQYPEVQFDYYNLKWINEQLIKHPDIADRHNILIDDSLNQEKKQPNAKLENETNSEEEPAYWAGGYHWEETQSQLDRFLKDNIWEIGWPKDHKKAQGFYKLAKKIKVNDHIALKSLGGNHILDIAAIGKVTNIDRAEDGKVDVEWTRTKGLYHGPGPKEEGAGNWFGTLLQVTRLDVIKQIFEEPYWWINANEKRWNVDNFQVGDEQTYGTHYNDGKTTQVLKNFFDAQLGDLGILYKVGNNNPGTKAVFEITKEAENREGDDIRFKIIYKFRDNEVVTFTELKEKEFFRKSEVIKRNNQASLLRLTSDEFTYIIGETSFRNLPDDESNKTINARITNDGLATKDLLDIENDVRSLALTLAAKEIKPPIAVALFGAWGSGKSFFMELLEKRVGELSVKQRFLGDGDDGKIKLTEENYCKGIVQIRFNAWSYLDANLWAGLVSTIFEKLDEYITGRTKGEKEKIELTNTLSDKLEILSSERNIVRKKKVKLQREKFTFKNKLNRLEQSKNELIENISRKNLAQIIKDAVSKSGLKEDTKCNLIKYGITEDRINEMMPTDLYKEVKSWYSFFKNLAQFSWKHIVLIILVLMSFLFVLIDPYGYATSLLNELGKTITKVICIVAPIFGKMYSSFNKYKKLVQPITDYKNRFNKEMEEATFEFEKEKDLLEKKLKSKQLEIEQTESKLKEVNEQIDNIDYTLNNFIAKRAFNNFINRKAKGKGYEQYLGLISIIRKDFETLSDLFKEIEVDHGVTREQKEIQNKKKKDHEHVVEQFEDGKALSRIILYIDDLDRCSDNKVLEVIQAVHLLLAFPLFNVVVGVDIKCVRNALIYKNLLQYNNVKLDEKIRTEDIHIISPDEYLEKIFQIPYHLSDPTTDNLEGMVDHILQGQIETGQSVNEGSGQANDDQDIDYEKPKIAPKYHQVSEQKRKLLEGILYEIIEKTKAKERKRKEEEQRKKVTPKDLKLTKEEVELIKDVIGFVGTVPRTIKRFVNIYRIIRAHKDYETYGGNNEHELLAIMFVLAVHIGKYKGLAGEFRNAVYSNQKEKLIVIIQEEVFASLLHEFAQKVNRDKQSLEKLLKLEGFRFIDHISSVGRFSFGNFDPNTF